MTTTNSVTPATLKLRVPAWVIVAIAVTTQVVLVMNTAIVTVALPGIHQAFGLSVDGQQWVINAYLVTFGGFLLFAARAGDLFGQKESVSNRAGALHARQPRRRAGPGQRMAARRPLRAGTRAAAMTPSTISLITTTPMAAHHRTRALSLWSAAAAIGGAAGLVIGGVLTSALGWRYVLFINVPLGAALLLAAAVSLLPAAARSDWRRLDIPGAVTVTAGAVALVYGLSDASASGWGSTGVIASLAAAVGLLAAFVVTETRAAAPLVPLGIFRHRPLSIANALFATLGVTLTAIVYFLSLYQEQVLGYSAIRTGLTLVPMTVVTAVGAIASQKMVPVFGPRMLLTVGGVVAAAGMAWLSRIPAHSEYPSSVLGPTLVAGAGMSLMLVPIVTAATIGIDRQHAGLASGLVKHVTSGRRSDRARDPGHRRRLRVPPRRAQRGGCRPRLPHRLCHHRRGQPRLSHPHRAAPGQTQARSPLTSH